MTVWRLSKISCPRLPQSVPCEAADAGEGGELGQGKSLSKQRKETGERKEKVISLTEGTERQPAIRSSSDRHPASWCSSGDSMQFSMTRSRLPMRMGVPGRMPWRLWASRSFQAEMRQKTISPLWTVRLVGGRWFCIFVFGGCIPDRGDMAKAFCRCVSWIYAESSGLSP